MAKRQRTMTDMLVRVTNPRESVSEIEHVVINPSTSIINNNEENYIKRANEEWKDAWYDLYDWVEFNKESGRVFCKTCREGGGKFVYASEGSTNVKISALQYHSKCNEHKKLSYAKHVGKKALEKCVAKANNACDEAVMSLFKAVYFLGKESIPCAKFASLCELLVSCKTPITEKLYHNEKACVEMMFAISTILQRQILDRIRDSRFFGIMIDESTDISVLGHLVIFATFLEGGVVTTSFLGLLWIVDGQKSSSVIFNLLIGALKSWGLDMSKCVGFGSDGASTMVGKNTGVATLLKKVNPFLTSTHCVAHKTNQLLWKLLKQTVVKNCRWKLIMY
jgi:hypothetical protein